MNLHDLRSAVVRIATSPGSRPGAGFVASSDGLIITCSHVVLPAELQQSGAAPPSQVEVTFSDGSRQKAIVLQSFWRSHSREDIAVLRVDGLPANARPLSLGQSAGTIGHAIRCYGFPAMGEVAGVWAVGEVQGPVQEGGVSRLQLRAPEVTTGFSGTPVWDEVTGRVLGVIHAVDRPDPLGRAGETAFAIPSEVIATVCKELKVSDECPYRSLESFKEEHARFYFGRDALVKRLVRSLHQDPRFLAVLAPSGSGKSSAVQAGLVPALRRGEIPGSERWGILTVRPGEDPLARLQQAGLDGASTDLVQATGEWLSGGVHSRLVLVIDPFEELLASGDAGMTRSFSEELEKLLRSPLAVTLVILLRDDFYSEFVRSARALAHRLSSSLVNIPPLEPADLHDIVVGPAKVAGLSVEPGLPETIARAAMEASKLTASAEDLCQASLLPLIEFCLTQIWERREDGTLTHDAYRSVGGVSGALTQWADHALHSLDESGRRIARRVLSNLVQLGDGACIPDTRRRRTLASLRALGEEPIETHSVLAHLADARLVTTGYDQRSREEYAELIHDALLREWAPLRRWVEGDRAFLNWSHDAYARAAAWTKTGTECGTERDEGRLLRGLELAEAEEWLRQRQAETNELTKEFISASVKLRRREEASRTRLRNRITQGALLGLAVALGLAGLAFWQAREARTQRDAAVARHLASQCLLDEDKFPAALLMASESVKRKPTPEGYEALLKSLDTRPYFVARMWHDEPVTFVVYSGDGRVIASASCDNTARAWDPATGRELCRVQHEGYVSCVALSSDGRIMASASWDGLARVSVVATGREVASLRHDAQVNSVCFSRDGTLVASTSSDGTVRVWTSEDGAEVFRVKLGVDETPYWAALSPDGKLVAASTRVWDIHSGRGVAQFDDLLGLALSPYGRWASVRYACTEGVPKLAGPLYELCGRSDPQTVRSPDGRWVATVVTEYEGWATARECVRIIDASTGHEIARLNHAGSAVAFSFDGSLLGVLDGQDNAAVYDWSTGRVVAMLGHVDMVSALAFAPDGTGIASGSYDATVTTWQRAPACETVAMAREGELLLALSPDGTRFATSDGTMTHVWLVGEGRRLMSLPFSASWAAFDASGKVLAASTETTVTVLEVASGRIRLSRDFGDYVHSMGLSADGSRLLAATYAHLSVIDTRTGATIFTAQSDFPSMDPLGRFVTITRRVAPTEGDDSTYTQELWGVEEGRRLPQIEGESTEFDPSAARVATYNWDGTIKVWSLESGQVLISLTHSAHPVCDVAFSPDGHYLVSGGADRVARVWDLDTGHETATFTHEDIADYVSFSPDGQWVVSSSPEPSGGTVCGWNAHSGALIIRVPGLEGVVSSDGRRLIVTTSRDGLRYDVIEPWLPSDLLVEASRRLPRNFTANEWAQYVGDEPYRKTFDQLYCPDLDEIRTPGETPAIVDRVNS